MASLDLRWRGWIAWWGNIIDSLGDFKFFNLLDTTDTPSID